MLSCVFGSVAVEKEKDFYFFYFLFTNLGVTKVEKMSGRLCGVYKV